MNIDEIIVLDTETSLENDEVGTFAAHPMCHKNWIVWLGLVSLGTDLSQTSDVILKKYPTIEDCNINMGFDSSRVLLVGHNIGFDLHYLCNPSNKSWESWVDFFNNPDTLIWDTQIAEYRLRGQSKTSPSLDWCCEQRGWETKPGRMKEYWDQGIGTEDIPDDEVRPYLTHDVSSTARLFKDQIARAAELGMLDMLRIEMKARITTLLMEHNGTCFDSDGAIKAREEKLKPELEECHEACTNAALALTGLKREAIKISSTTWMKQILYGGTVKWREQLEMKDEDGNPMYFKSGKKKGQIRMKWYDFEEEVGRLAPPGPWEKADEETFGKIMEHAKCPPDLAAFMSLVLRHRDLTKQVGTYFTGYSELTWPDGMIHGNLNHAIAATGRLTSTNPNLQNAGHSPIRKHFVSRYEGGRLMEVDLSQIEVVVQAFLSNDPHMREDIINGVDFHSKRAAFAAHADYEHVRTAATDDSHPEHKLWKKKRKDAKIVSFQKAYGAGVKKIADTTGLPRSEVQAFMDAEDANYPNVPTTQAAWIEEVDRSTQIRDGQTCGILTSPIGVQYRFFQENFNGHKTYKPTTIKNYPIQGLAADILKIILSDLRRVVNDFNKDHTTLDPVLIINTVHDSVIFDVPAEVDETLLARTLVQHFTQYPVFVLKDTFGVDFNIPISADADVGYNWYEMTGVTI